MAAVLRVPPRRVYRTTSIDAGSQDLSDTLVLRPGVSVRPCPSTGARSPRPLPYRSHGAAHSASRPYGSVVSQIARPDGSTVMPFVNEGLYRFRVFLAAVKAKSVTRLCRGYSRATRLRRGIRIDTEWYLRSKSQEDKRRFG